MDVPVPYRSELVSAIALELASNQRWMLTVNAFKFQGSRYSAGLSRRRAAAAPGRRRICEYRAACQAGRDISKLGST